MLHPNDLMICVPNIVFGKSMISIDFEMRSVVLSPEYMKSMVLFECSSWSFRSFVEQHPVFSLNDDEARLLNSIIICCMKSWQELLASIKKNYLMPCWKCFTMIFMIQWNVSIMKIQKHFLLLKCCLGIFLNCWMFLETIVVKLHFMLINFMFRLSIFLLYAKK